MAKVRKLTERLREYAATFDAASTMYASHPAVLADEAAEAIERLERERDEAQKSTARWIGRLSEIREASGLGAKPMLDELPAAIGRIATDLAYAKQALDRETARALKFGKELQAAESKLSEMRSALEPFAFRGMEWRHGSHVQIRIEMSYIQAARRALEPKP